MESKIFLGKYRVAPKEIAAVGEVTDSALAYKAEEIDSGKQVVVEVVPAGSLKQAVRERLETEALAAKKLNHVNIPTLSDFGVAGDHLVYVTEDFEGTSADKWVNAHGPMPARSVLCIASQVVSALGAASFHGISHHALNPSNLVLVPGQTAEGEWPLVKVLHFVGVPPKVSQTDSAVAAFDPSLHYASPEQIKNGTVDFRSELYSLGATMWFLMTGAPPLVAPAGSMATPPAKAGVAAEKIEAMPEKVRLLLAQMLAAIPEARPPDPLAFYRSLQDCLHQVERREARSGASGIPARAPAPTLDHSHRRRFPFKRFALAAAFLAAAAVAALLVSGYLRHRRDVLAAEPIGKPVGVPEAAGSAPPIVADARAFASIAQTAATPAPLAVSGPPKDSQLQEPEIVAVINTRALPTAVDSREFVSSKPAEPEPTKSPGAESVAVAPQTESKANVPEVRRAEPADEPEVRRAELVRSDEGPTEVKPNRTTSLVLKRTDSQPEVPPEPTAPKTEQPAKPKRPMNEKTYLLPGYEFEAPPIGRLPRGSVRGRFVGETADGRWMFELPSREIVTVQPPSSR